MGCSMRKKIQIIIMLIITIFPLNIALNSTKHFAILSPITVTDSSPLATVYVFPETIVGMPDQKFTIEIRIEDVNDLYGWEFRLAWNTAVLEVLDIEEGPFLKTGGETFFTYIINDTEGYMIVDCTLLGNVPGVSGNGSLASVHFCAVASGDSPLDLYDTILVSSLEEPISHEVIDGYYYTSVHDVAIINLQASKFNVNVTVENQGTHTETFNVSTYYTRLTDPLIGTQTVTLEQGANITLTFAWSPPTYGRYEILAEASIVPGEVDTDDNTYTTIIYIRDISSLSSGGASVGRCKRMLR